MHELASGGDRPLADAVSPLLRIVVAVKSQRLRQQLGECLDRFSYRYVDAASIDAVTELLGLDPSLNVLLLDMAMETQEERSLTAAARQVRADSGRLGVILLADAPDHRWLKAAMAQGPTEMLLLPLAKAELQSALNYLEELVPYGAASVEELQSEVATVAHAVMRIAERLDRIARNNQLPPQTGSVIDEPVIAPEDRDTMIACVRRLIRERKMREKFFADARFGEPAWDILLDLTLAWLEDHNVATSSVAIASGVPMSTAMRWVGEMVEAGLIDRWSDPNDGRRNFVQISRLSQTAMREYLTAVRSAEQHQANGG